MRRPLVIGTAVATVSVVAIGLIALLAIGAGGGPAEDVAFSGVDPSSGHRYAAQALSDDSVVAELGGARSRVVEVVDPLDGKSGPVVWIVDYTNARSIAVELTKDGSRVAAHSIHSFGQPNFSPAETREATEVALSSAKVLARTQGRPYMVSSVTGGSCTGGRCLAVFLVPATGDYEGLIVAIVDLRQEAVVDFAR